MNPKLIELRNDEGGEEEVSPEKLDFSIRALRAKTKALISQVKLSSNELKQKHIEEIRKSFKKLRAMASTAAFTRKKDKLTFFLFVVYLILSNFTLGRVPCLYPDVYTASAIFLLTMRFILYRLTKNHYFLIEFCYYGNVLTMAYIWFFRDSALLYYAAFAFSHGSLLVSVILFRNSLVPHSVDLITSHFVHMAPSLALWSLRTADCGEYPVFEPAGIEMYMFCALAFYVVWVLPYSLIIFGFGKRRISRKNNEFLYKYVMESRSALAILPMKVGEALRPLVYLLQHMLSTMCFALLSYALLTNFWVETAAISVVFCVSIWNGASYYIEYFSVKYDKKLLRVEEMTKLLENQAC